MTTTKTDRETCARPRRCSECGGTESFERPRYFAGQLLTDRDLEAEQRYLIEKNRLRNRHLVGSGVVCGLAVHCDPCEGMVVVDPGYAIDACGNDIVVCEPSLFDVKGYIEKCLTPPPPICEGKIKTSTPDRCDGKPKEYCLVLSYDEQPSRPVNALTADCRQTRCEPSRVRETFRLDLVEEVRKAPEQGALDRIMACLRTALRETGNKNDTRIPISLGDGKTYAVPWLDDILKHVNDQGNLKGDLCRLEDFIKKLYREHHPVRCHVDDELDALCEAMSQNGSMTDSRERFALVWMHYLHLLRFLRDCICEALLVPCAPCEEPGVVIARVTVCEGKVTAICNWARTQVLTGPALRHWLSPLFRSTGGGVEHMCCDLDLTGKDAQEFPQQLLGLIDQFVPWVQMMSGPQVAAGGYKSIQPAGRFAARARIAEQMVRDHILRVAGGAKTVPDLGEGLALDLPALFDPSAITPLDLYGRSQAEVVAELDRAGLRDIAKFKKAPAKDTGDSLPKSWRIGADSRIELLLDAGKRVIGVRKLNGGGPP